MVADRPAPQALTRAGASGRRHHGPQGPGVKAQIDSPQRSEGQELKDAWIALLAPFSFQWFCTFTFATNVHPEQGFKTFRRFSNELNRRLYGRRWERSAHGGVFWIVALERQKRGVVHFHALLGAVDDLNGMANRFEWMKRWQALAGFARIEAIRDNQAARRYVTKYVVKGGDIEFSKNLDRSQRA